MKRFVILLCLVLGACIVDPIDNLDLNGAVNPRPYMNPIITIEDGGVKMPDNIATEVELCAKDEGCIAHIK